MTTLGDIRQYASEISYDSSDEKADRAYMRWINQGLQEIVRAHNWTYYRSYSRIYLDVEETGDNMSLTQDSNVVTLTSSEYFANKYVTEKWDLIVDGEGDVAHRLTELMDSENGRLADKWIRATSATTSYTWTRYAYPLPARVKQIHLVEDTDSRLEVLDARTPERFDRLRQSQPGLRDSFPRYYLIREGNIEFWPSAGTERQLVALTYDRKPPLYKKADPDSTVIDFKEEWSDLVEKAVAVQCSIEMGEAAQIPYPLARTSFEDCLRDYVAEDADLTKQNLQIYPTMPWTRLSGSMSPAFYRNPTDLTDPS